MKKCSKCLKMKQISKFPKDKSLLDGHKNTCKDCDAERKRNKAKIMKKRIVEYIGGKLECNHCGYTYSTLTPFNFHHVNPTEKENTISHMLDNRWERVKAEVDKCILLCANCHLIEHHE